MVGERPAIHQLDCSSLQERREPALPNSLRRSHTVKSHFAVLQVREGAQKPKKRFATLRTIQSWATVALRARYGGQFGLQGPRGPALDRGTSVKSVLRPSQDRSDTIDSREKTLLHPGEGTGGSGCA